MTEIRHTKGSPVSVIFPGAITTFAFEAAERLCSAVERLTGIRPVRSCAAASESDPAAPAILVGGNSYPSQKKILAGLNCGICLLTSPSPDLLVCATHTEETLIGAVDLLCSNMRYDGEKLAFDGCEGKKIYLPGLLRFLPAPDCGRTVACRKSHDLCDQIVVCGTTADDFANYLLKLEAAGFETVFEREVAGNLFRRLEKDGCSAYVYFTPFNSTMRILCEPAANLHRDRECVQEKTCQPLMTVVGARWSNTAEYLNRDAGSGNMGYIFRLEDGSFILVDGGMELGDYAEKILAALREQTPAGETPRIRCWFLSHTHIDHTGAFLKIAAKYPDSVILEEVACNFPSIPDAEIFREAWNTRRVKEAVYKSFPGAKYSKIHSGQILRFGETEVEVLWTQDDLVREYLSLGNVTLNTASACIRLKIGGNTVLLPADCDETANDIMLKTYGGYLKSDILQVCHHGGWGGTTPFYEAVDPEVAIFSTSDELLPMYLQIKYNHDLVYGMHVREVHNNADRFRVFPLPYHPAETSLPPDPAGEILYTKAKQLEALAQIEKIRAEKNGK
ncbi:MAG: MBL fold metallo-hydrolase [Clostridia bacterium]|nr:MBL fold metallo-hydrolase [Clostridia bacterium]